MITLADEMLAALPGLLGQYPDGPSLRVIASKIGADIASVRRAAKQLNTDARADLMRRPDSREQFLVSFRYRKALGLRYCAHCDGTFQAERTKTSTGSYYSDRRCCSRKCGIAWSWSRPGVRERRAAGIAVSKGTPEAMSQLADHNKRRWSKPEERARLAEQNRREWADPVKASLRAQSIAAVNGSPEMRELYSNLRKNWWKDPAMREKMQAAMTAAHQTPEHRLAAHERMKARWQDPEYRKKMIAATKQNLRKAIAANRGRKQPQSQIQKRVSSTRAAKQNSSVHQ